MTKSELEEAIEDIELAKGVVMFHKGDEIVCISDFENHWGNCDQIKGNLTVGKAYIISDVEVHNWHTKIRLIECPYKVFNSVHFEVSSSRKS